MQNFETDDLVVVALGQIMKEQESYRHVVNKGRVDTLLKTYDDLNQMFCGTDVCVEYNLFKPFKWCGSVVVKGKDICVNQIAKFIKATYNSDTVDIYPRTDGKVQIDFGFLGLAKRRKENG